MNPNSKPRDHHYWFVREFYNFVNYRTGVKAKLFKHNADCIIDPLNKKWTLKTIKSIWYDVFVGLKKQDKNVEKVDFDGMDFFVEPIDAKSFITIVTLPKPIAMVESYYIGIYFKEKKEEDKTFFDDPMLDYYVSNTDVRFFTLELSSDGKQAFCELHPDFRHSLLAFFENIDEKEFLEVIKKVIN